ncbi:hypothetical protein DPMN_169495 [Dreissena polymorpha]|uniref:G-protein coupled receptors family 2 profile 2 domain-containing protein n=1 Tax=Dreissena polymorpha TaxID=45954 RepID=A0A9D4DW51_DREPO|nr:hypothetical protein DPMN_169495 [Dreissena polymorpha]
MYQTDAKQIVGISLLVAAMILQIVCILLTRILIKLEYGGYMAVMRTWLFLSSTMEHVFYIIFHVNYTYIKSGDEQPDTCILMRFLMSFCSTFTTMWILTIAAFYLVMPIKPEKCLSSIVRFLTHCVALTWTFVSCLLYLVIAFRLKADNALEYIHSCWNDISNTLHFYNCYGNEIIPFLVTAFILVNARFRISTHKRTMSSRMPEYHVNVTQLRRTINRYIVLIVFLFIYYIGLYIRFVFDKRGSDLVMMAMQCGRSVAIAVTVCLLDKDVLALIFRRPFSTPMLLLHPNEIGLQSLSTELTLVECT